MTSLTLTRFCRTCFGPMSYHEELLRWVCELGHEERPYLPSDEN